MAMLSLLSTLSITASITLNMVLGLSQFIGSPTKRRLLLGFIFFIMAYLNYHLALLVSKDLILKSQHFLAYIPCLLLLGPLLKLFFQDVQESLPLSFKKEAIFFVPFLISIALFPTLLFMDPSEKVILIKTLYNAPATSIYSALSLGAILIFSGFILRIASMQPNYFRQQVPHTQKRLFTLFAITLTTFILILLVLSILFGSLATLKLGTIIFFIPFLTTFVYYLRYPKVFEKWTEDIQLKHYEHTHLNNMDIPDLLDDLKALLEEEKVYKDPELTLSNLATQLDINPHQLSELINQNLQKNFSQLINDYRIKEAKKILKEDHIHTVLSIAFKVGFNSYSSFYQHFKDTVGESPASYRKQFE